MAADSLKGKVAIVTGGAGGIGGALVRAFVGSGMRVVAVDNDNAAAAALEGEFGPGQVQSLIADVADPGAAGAAHALAIKDFGGLHVLVNNAAIGMNAITRDHMTRTVGIEEIDFELWQRFLAVNLSGAFAMAKMAIHHFRHQRWGRIVNVTTSFFTMLRPGFSPYGPSKAALEAWSASLAGELKGTGITVNVVVPGGPTDTGFVPKESGLDRKLLIRPERMAPPILWLLSRAGAGASGMRYVAADWDPALPAAKAAAKAGAPAGWPSLAQNPVWPGGKPGGA